MNHTLSKIANVVVDVARREDLILRRVGKGVLQIPELAFVYAVGREIALEAETIFGTPNVQWLPETSIHQASGRTDLVFVADSQSGIAMEFKIGGRSDTYVDLENYALVRE